MSSDVTGNLSKSATARRVRDVASARSDPSSAMFQSTDEPPPLFLFVIASQFSKGSPSSKQSAKLRARKIASLNDTKPITQACELTHKLLQLFFNLNDLLSHLGRVQGTALLVRSEGDLVFHVLPPFAEPPQSLPAGVFSANKFLVQSVGYAAAPLPLARHWWQYYKARRPLEQASKLFNLRSGCASSI
jgi:hypothetical protein